MPAAPPDNIYTPRQQYVLLIVCLVALATLILLGLGSYTTAFLGAGILFVVFRPWFNALVHRRRWNRQVVSIGLLVFAFVVIILPFSALSLMLVDRIRHYGQDTSQIMAVLHTIEQKTGYRFSTEPNVRSLLQQSVSWISQRLPSLASGLLHFTVVIGLMLFTLYFMFTQEAGFLRGLRRYLPFRTNTLHELGESLRNTVNANVLGQALISLVQATLTGLALWFFQVPDALFWGVVAFFMAFIPVLGTPLVWGPAAIIKLTQGHTGQGVGILIVGLVVIMNIDNLLRIVLARRIGNIHPLITLAGVVLGVEIFGILGLVLGPLLLSYFIVLMQVFERENRLHPKLKAKRTHTLPHTDPAADENTAAPAAT
ncbi:AI-2E family transporter [Hymenobacter taeanensis]|uniref:AI-2E family transporter n=1 Tax=Hymenobacter taeanensis TaxID=2735321 RepID=A0A6M6BJV4_9BACT|nr:MULTISPECIES: AI-2E family transporter [Hymenobacter]QJX48340.1 AI-2E family transporter [Hymenobacter taeanensis]UOQ82169.1 AI-2E family transporter [Hymenobacter sp. 5414T-23]